MIFPDVQNGAVIKDTFRPEVPTGMLGFVFNTRRPVFADPNVREALALAFTRERSSSETFVEVSRTAKAYSFQEKIRQKIAVEAIPVAACGSTTLRKAWKRV